MNKPKTVIRQRLLYVQKCLKQQAESCLNIARDEAMKSLLGSLESENIKLAKTALLHYGQYLGYSVALNNLDSCIRLTPQIEE